MVRKSWPPIHTDKRGCGEIRSLLLAVTGIFEVFYHNDRPLNRLGEEVGRQDTREARPAYGCAASGKNFDRNEVTAACPRDSFSEMEGVNQMKKRLRVACNVACPSFREDRTRYNRLFSRLPREFAIAALNYASRRGPNVPDQSDRHARALMPAMRYTADLNDRA